MRIIAGEYKGRQLKPVPGMKTRPTSDKIKEAVFHRMGPFFEKGQCLDLFAGSGALGLEALSRGMEKTIFVDSSIQAVKTIRHHVEMLKIAEKCEVYRNDAFKAVNVLSKREARFSLILLDPPYDETLYQSLIDRLLEAELLQQDGLLYIEHRPNAAFTVAGNKMEVIFKREYTKTTSVTILKKK